MGAEVLWVNELLQVEGSEMYSQRMERQVIEVDQWKQVVESISRQNSAVISGEGLENQRNNMGGAEDREEDRQYHGWLAGQVREWMKKTSWWQWDGKREWVIYAEWSICEVKKCN